MKRHAPAAYTIYQSNLRHFRKRWNERYAQEHGEFSRVHRRLLLDHIYYGESRWVNYGLTQRALLSIEAVPFILMEAPSLSSTTKPATTCSAPSTPTTSKSGATRHGSGVNGWAGGRRV